MSNKLTVITGASKGIGNAIAQTFAKQGHHLALSSRSATDLKKLKGILLSINPNIEIYTFAHDLGKKEEVKKFGEELLALPHPIDVLVNNVGVFLPGSSIHNEEDAILETQLEVNLLSGYYLTKMIVGQMKNRREGYIFNICSVASVVAYPSGGSYCISKFAQYGMTKVLREEMKPYGIKVTAILPGATKTASWEGVDLPDDRLMKPEDVAEAAWSAYSLSKNSVMEEIVIRPQLGDL